MFLSFQNANRLSASAQLGNKARAASLANLETRQRELVHLRQLTNINRVFTWPLDQPRHASITVCTLSIPVRAQIAEENAGRLFSRLRVNNTKAVSWEEVERATIVPPHAN